MIKINHKISVVIPAYNESENLGRVLSVICNIDWLDEIIVVDDCSVDKTAYVAKKFPVKVIRHQTNQGKGGAMATGIGAAKNDLLLFLDADLIGLKEEHLLKILAPIVFTKEADLSLGVFGLDEFSGTNIANRVAPSISGQRAIWRQNLPPIERIATKRYGVDLYITRHIKKSRRAIIKLKSLTQVTKEDKSDDLVSTVKSRVTMYKEIIKMLKEEKQNNNMF